MDVLQIDYRSTLTLTHDPHSDNPLHNVLIYDTFEEFSVDSIVPVGTTLFASKQLTLVSCDKALDNLANDKLIKLLFEPTACSTDTGEKILRYPNICLVGKRVFAGITNTKHRNLDIYLYGDKEQAQKELAALESKLSSNNFLNLDRQAALADIPSTPDNQIRINLESACFRISRNSTSITFVRTCQYEVDVTKTDYVYIDGDRHPIRSTTKNYRGQVVTFKVQVYLAIYRSISHLLHNMDVDCAGLGYDGRHMLLTPRCMYALKQGYNTVNLNLAQSYYVKNLLKYAHRGMKIFVPGVSRTANLEAKLAKILNNINLGQQSVPTFNGLMQLLLAELAWTRDGDKLFVTNDESHEWCRLPIVLHERLAKFVDLPIESRQYLSGIYSSETLSGYENRTLINCNNIAKIFKFLDSTVDGFLGRTISLHNASMAELDEQQMFAVVEYFQQLLTNRQVKDQWLSLEVCIQKEKIAAVRCAEHRPTIPKAIYDILCQSMDMGVPAEESFTEAQDVSPMSMRDQIAWMNIDL